MTTFQLVNLIITILLTHLIIFELGRKKGMRDIKRIYENKKKQSSFIDVRLKE